MSTGSRRVARTLGIALLWLVTLLEAAGMGFAGWSKFGNAEGWTGMFENWGYPPWFAFVIGASEMAGAAVLLVPRLATYAAGFLAVIMLGALGTDIVVGALGVAAPILNLVALTIIGLARSNQRWKPGRKRETDPPGETTRAAAQQTPG